MIPGLDLDLPEDLSYLLEVGPWEVRTFGYSGVEIFRIAHAFGEEAAYLKVSIDRPFTDLEAERRVLAWLEHRLPVPRVLGYVQEREARQEWLLMTEVPGKSCIAPEFLIDPEPMVRLLAQGLRMFHYVDITDCPIDQRLDRKLRDTGERVAKGLVDVDDFEAENLGCQPEDLYRRLLATRPQDEDPVFTHGDYCLPNILIHEGRLSGFVDLALGGVADRYQDLALAARSLRHNLHGEQRWVNLFFHVYGIDEPDQAKLAYYTLLDELF